MSRMLRWFHLNCFLVLMVGSGWGRAEELTWHKESNARWADLPVQASSKVGFTLLPSSRTGLDFTNSVDAMAAAASRILLNGAGLATGDFDNDGLIDIFLCSLSGGSKLYKNLGSFRFQDVTAKAGIFVHSYETACVHLRRIYAKLQVRSRTEAILKYIQAQRIPKRPLAPICSSGGTEFGDRLHFLTAESLRLATELQRYGREIAELHASHRISPDQTRRSGRSARSVLGKLEQNVARRICPASFPDSTNEAA